MKNMENSIASIYPSVDSSIVSNKLGIVKDIFYWLPEKDDARVFLVAAIAQNFSRSEERRVGKECSEPCRSRWSPYH